MKINLFDYYRKELLPLTFTRPVGDLRCGIFTFAERWKILIKNSTIGFQTEPYLQKKYPAIKSNNLYFINACIFPNKKFIDILYNLDLHQALFYKNILLAYRKSNKYYSLINFKSILFNHEIKIIKYPWDLFGYNYKALEFDFMLIKNQRISQRISHTNKIIGNHKKVFLEEGAKLEYSTLNTQNGSIYIGKNAEVMEGSNIRGSFSLGEGSIIHMGSKIYGATTIGPYCKIGGEINNVIFWGYSNKSHEGFLGNSIIGQWCNFGANTNCSNLKNNYSEVKCWSYKEQKFIYTKLQFCGTIFGDYSRTGINTKINTGTVVGIFANIFCNGFPSSHVNSFSWGGEGDEKFKLLKVFELAKRVMSRKNIIFDQIEENILKKLYNFLL